MDRFERSAVPARLPANGRSLAGKLRELIGEGRGLPTLALLELLDHLDAGRIKQAEELAAQIINGAAEPDGEFLMRFWAGLSAPPPSRPCRGIDLKAVSDALSGQIDPAHQHSFVRNRVLSGINGLGTDGLLPPEVCLGLDLPAWRFLRDHAPDWLLPGAERIAPDSVIGLESNSEFIEAFLLGINKQALSEFRWRNIPIKSKCTPIKMFWGQVGRGGITRERDITGVEVWPNESRLGHNAHRPEGSPNGNFVLLIRGDLFRRYPETSVYLVSGGQPGGPPDPSTVAGADREFPNFQGGIGADITFFRFDITADDAKSYWVVIEETPRGYSFVNDRVLEPARSDPRAGAYAIAKDGKDFAIAAFADPVRVLIRAEDILP
jgi:hypothetical protein